MSSCCFDITSIPDFLFDLFACCGATRATRANFCFVVPVTENKSSHSWSAIHNTPMLLWSEQRWAQAVREAGFQVLRQWRSGLGGGGGGGNEGTMSIIARNTHTAPAALDEGAVQIDL